MTEYDFSPGAVRAHIEKLQKIERWTLQVDPHNVRDAHTPATPAPETFTSLPRDENSRTHRPKHSRGASYERDRGGYGYEKKRDRERYRDRERDESIDRRSRDRDRDRSYDADDSYEGTVKPRTHRSKSHNVVTPPAKHPPPATRSYTMPLKPTNTRRPSSNSNEVYRYPSGPATQSQAQIYKGSSYDLNSQTHPSSRQGSKYNLPATAPAAPTRHHNPRSASTNDVTTNPGANGKYPTSSSAQVYDQNKYYPSRASLDQPHSAPAPPANGNSRQPPSATLPRAKATRTHSASVSTYPYANGGYASQSQAPLQQPQQPQLSHVYLPSKSQSHLPQPQPQPAPPPPLPTAAANGRKPPPAPLNLPPHPNMPQPNGYPPQPYTSSKLSPYYQPAPGPHSAPAPAGSYPPVPGASGYPSASTGQTGSAPNSAAVAAAAGAQAGGAYPLPPGFQPQSGPMPISPNRITFQTPAPAPAPTPVPIPPLPQYPGPMPSLKEKPKPLIKRLFTTLTGSGSNKASSNASIAGSTPRNSPTPEYVIPGAQNKSTMRGVSLDSGARPLSAPPVRSVRSKDRDQQRERERDKDRRPRDRDRDYDRDRSRSRTATGLVAGDFEKVGERWYDMYDSSMDQEQDKEWELVAKEERWKEGRERERTHVRSGTLKKRSAGERERGVRRERERGGHDRRLSH